MWARLEYDPTTRAFLQQDDFKNKMLDVQENPSTLNRHLKDPRIMQALGVLLNVKLRRPNSAEDADIPDAETTEEEPEPEDMEVPEEEREARDRKKEAHKEKEKGNAAYKKKDFEAAIQHYTKAIELDDKDISLLTNRATLSCDDASESVASEKWLQKLHDELQKQGITLPERLNEDQIRRFYAAANGEISSNGWPCLIIRLGLACSNMRSNSRSDIVKAVVSQIDNGVSHANDEILCYAIARSLPKLSWVKHEPPNQELLDGVRRHVEQINKASCGDLSPEKLKEREVKAIQDPEIQSILMDPVMSQVLIDFDENPKAALEHARNPVVMNKIQKAGQHRDCPDEMKRGLMQVHRQNISIC
ncbi:stress-inducible protein [Actinidia rufa]|uniref:Stress-inducible protein n=1 Tax=Actinidia rufa TaxID=165716 RepID=A0A7J0DD71_9ERIC|nr:stress-inducible protein [Actinidia rufa]